MANVAKIFVDGISSFSKGHYIQGLDYSILQSCDTAGKPSGRPIGGRINIVFESLFDNTELFQWAVNVKDTRSGKVVFTNEEEGIDLIMGTIQKKTLSFTDAACVSFLETFISNGSSKTHITLVAKSIKLNSVEYKNPWPENT